MRTDIEFRTEDGVILRGWHYRPADGGGPWPTVVMAHGYSAHCKHPNIGTPAERYPDNKKTRQRIAEPVHPSRLSSVAATRIGKR